MKVSAIMINTFREAVRNKILYSVVLFAVVLVGISAFFGAVSIGSQEKVIKDFGLFSLSFFGVIITILSGVSLLNKELKQKTIYNILSKPVDRWQFILGKHLGLTLTVSLLVGLMGVGLIGFVAFFEGRIDLLLFQGIFFVILEVTLMAAVAIFFSSLVVTTTLTGIFTLGTYVAGRSIAYLRYFIEAGDGYNPALAKLIGILDWVLPDLSLFNVHDVLVDGGSVTGNHAAYAICYCVSYSLVALTLAAIIFERRELN
ncbi:MAG: ABC transporter permease subunit [Bdellovibrionales bacterium]|nr:ABC transporter permease subunit [Bdellovibrionales bacterium]